MLKNYLKTALNGLMRQKYYTFISLFGIVITLTVLTVSVAILNHFTLMGKPGSRLSRCLIVDRVEAAFKRAKIITLPSYYLLDRYVRNLKGPEAISLFSGGQEIVAYAENSRIAQILKYTDEVFWDITEFPFLEGVPYLREALDRADMVAVITDRARQNIFGTKPALGQYLETSQGTFRVIGIIPYREIRGMFLNADIFAPITTSLDNMTNKNLWGSGNALVQAADKSQFPSIKREFQDHMDQLIKDYKDELQLQTFECFLGTMNESIANQTNQSGVVYYLGIVGIMILFMLLPAVNLTTVGISRIMERFSEIGIRKAFGASSTTLMGQFIIENTFLTLIGGVLAYILSLVIIDLLNRSGMVPWGYIRLDAVVFFLSMLIAVFFGIFSGVLPSYRMSRLHPAQALKGVSR